MNYINQFIENNKCPLCDKELTLFILYNNSLLQGQLVEPGFFKFKYYNSKEETETVNLLENKMIITDDFIECFQQPFSFLYICNPSTESITTFDLKINPYYACFYKKSQNFIIKNNEVFQENEESIYINGAEVLTFKENIEKDNSENVYILNIINDDKQSILFHYNSYTVNQLVAGTIFEKKINYVIDINTNESIDKTKLLKKFEKWITFS